MAEDSIQEQSSADLLTETRTDGCIDPVQNTKGETSLLEQLRCDQVIRFKVLLSVCVSLAYGILGWTKGQSGPAFLDILVISGTDIEKGSAFMTSYYVGRMVGPILIGIFYSKINKNLIFAITMTTCSVTVVWIPWCTGFELMLIAHGLYGISGGIISIVVVSEAVVIWGGTSRGRSYLQILNTVFAVFSVLSPLATAPFLLPTSGNETYHHGNSSNVTKGQYDFKPMVTNTSFPHLDAKVFDNSTVSSFPESTSRLYIAYTISASIMIIGVIPFYVLYCKSLSSDIQTNQSEHISYKFLGNRSLLVKRLQFVNVGIFSFFYYDLDFTFSGFLSAFCVLGLNWTKTSAAYLTSVVFFATLFGRISGIFLVQIVHVRTILLCSTFAYTAGYIGILISAHARVEVGIWISICFVGFPFGLSWPTFISWVNENLLPVYGKVPALINFIGFSGCVFNPLLLGYLIEEISPFWFIYLSVGKSVVTIVNVLFMFVYSFSPFKSQNTTQSTNEQKQTDDMCE